MRRLRTLLLLLALTPLTFQHIVLAGKPARCPQMKEGVACAQVYDPVVCGKCEYGNLCEAKASGFRAEQCVKKGAKRKICPPPEVVAACGGELKPVVCQGVCEYASLCLAKAAGFEATQCRLKAD